MKHIISAFGVLFALVLALFMCASVASESGQVAAAKEYKADVIAQIENSNFNPNVIADCIRQASDAGYQLEVNSCTYDENSDIQTAEVILTYQCEMPLFGISESKTTRGIAR